MFVPTWQRFFLYHFKDLIFPVGTKCNKAVMFCLPDFCFTNIKAWKLMVGRDSVWKASFLGSSRCSNVRFSGVYQGFSMYFRPFIIGAPRCFTPWRSANKAYRGRVSIDSDSVRPIGSKRWVNFVTDITMTWNFYPRHSVYSLSLLFSSFLFLPSSFPTSFSSFSCPRCWPNAASSISPILFAHFPLPL